MPTFTVLRRQDAYVDYLAEVEADTPQAAADLAYEQDGLVWEPRGVTEFDANRVVTLDDDGAEIDSTARGKG
jgi:hypothetical protein